MGNPQLENGYIRIAIEIVDELQKLHLSGNEWQIVWVVLRKTWGWGKKKDSISLSQFEKESGLSRPSVSEAISKLVGKKVLVVKKEPFINIYSFNKLYNDWMVGKRVLVGFSVSNSREKGTRVVGKKELKLVPKKEHTIDNINTNTINTIQKIESYPKKITDISTEDMQKIADRYNVPLAFVKSKADDMANWHDQNPRKNTRVNWVATLRTWVKRDAIQIMERQQSRVNKFAVTEV